MGVAAAKPLPVALAPPVLGSHMCAAKRPGVQFHARSFEVWSAAQLPEMTRIANMVDVADISGRLGYNKFSFDSVNFCTSKGTSFPYVYFGIRKKGLVNHVPKFVV